MRPPPSSAAAARGPVDLLRTAARSLLLPALPAPGPGVPVPPDGGVSVTYVGHATVLLRFAGATVLTDPVWSDRLVVPKRLVAPGVALDALPRVDVVLVSHGHRDHLDVPTHRRLRTRDAVAVVARRLGDLVAGCGYREVVELAWGESVRLDALTVTAVPVNHWGTRDLVPDGRGWTGFVLEHADGTVFFPGDTAYWPRFGEVGARWPIDVALLPIGAYSPAPLRRVHMNPEDALRAFLDLGARHLVPIHWGTFVLSAEPVDEPVRWLRELAAAQGVGHRLAVLAHGASRRFARA